MELRQLRYFVAVAEAGSFSAAAARLFVAQPALSVQLRQLEDAVGQPLLLRHRRGVALTPAGRAFLEDARLLQTQLLDAVARARAHGERPRPLRLGLVPSASQTVLPALVRALRATHAGLAIEAREMSTQAQIDGLAEGRLDYAIGRPAHANQAVQVLHQQDDPYCVALPADHALAGRTGLRMAALAREDFVSFGRERGANYFDRMIALCMEGGFSPAIRHEANTFSSALGMVAAGLGVSIVPASCVLLAHPGVVLRRLPASRHRSVLALLWSTARPHPLHDEVEAVVARHWRQMRKAVAAALH